MVWCTTLFVVCWWHGLPGLPGLPGFTEGWVILKKQIVGCDLLLLIVMIRIESSK
ncbi:TPA: hypothetical protein ACWMJW_002833 [Staphylococcus aureus]|uniref:Uncharacterized protein n=1 Tax=Staphylococcus aureus TaxID=1280 RepID=A0A6B0CI23_STAAU|nr:hypothetical protein [Staphylococcus aureus]MBN5783898.1 hypothetical protein [Staphylococcus aureus]MBR8891821.1 hypothetical protein [Staphylococcus aureus]MBR8934589.1 hypothetical protein [Staphylococcus aureus]MDI1751909.1 hypothetical protein [Staphylococcus aureus]MVG86226.1 hypothetical protein [Staphylococcus aureus]